MTAIARALGLSVSRVSKIIATMAFEAKVEIEPVMQVKNRMSRRCLGVQPA